MAIEKIGDDGVNHPNLILNYLEPSDYHPSKGTSSTYSRQLNKLFVNIHKVVQIGFQTNFTPPLNSFIRCTPRFDLEEYQHEVVKCCPNHRDPNLRNGNHIVTVDSTGPRRNFPVRYVNGGVDQQPAVCIEYLKPSEHIRGEECIIKFTFHCLSSCSSMIARRDINLVFELVQNDGPICSRVLPVVISTCPGRDRSRHERKATLNLADAMMEVMDGGIEDENGEDGILFVEIDDPMVEDLLRIFLNGIEREP